MEPANSLGVAEWRRSPLLEALIEAGRRPDASGWDEERKERLYQQIMIRVERRQARRRFLRAFAAGASTVLVAGLLLRLAGIEMP